MMRNTKKTKQFENQINSSPLVLDSATIINLLDLINQGADPNTKDSSGNSLLHRLSSEKNNIDGRQDELIRELVIKYKADINIKNAKGLTPLECVLRRSCIIRDVMSLVRLGANPDTKNFFGDSLLHLLSSEDNNINGRHDVLLRELVIKYKADINIKNAKGLTPLECILRRPCTVRDAMNLVRLGADPEAKNAYGESLLYLLLCREEKCPGILNGLIQEVERCLILADPRSQLPRAEFLTLLLILAKDRWNDQSDSFLKKLPLEIIIYILSFLSFKPMGKTCAEGQRLAEFILNPDNLATIQDMLKHPGGINIFQKNNDNGLPTFTFFKSAISLSQDFSKLKENLKNKPQNGYGLTYLARIIAAKISLQEPQKLQEFREKYAIDYFLQHQKLFTHPKNKLKLIKSIQNTELYNHPLTQSIIGKNR